MTNKELAEYLTMAREYLDKSDTTFTEASSSYSLSSIATSLFIIAERMVNKDRKPKASPKSHRILHPEKNQSCHTG